MALYQIDQEQKLYVIQAGQGLSSLGFDVAFNRALNVAQWLDKEGQIAEQPDPEFKGTKLGYEQYQRIIQQLCQYCRTSRKQCDAELIPQLVGKEHSQVEVTEFDGTSRKFWVGKSLGWLPCHLELPQKNSRSGSPVYGPLKSVTVIKKAA